MLFRMIDTIRKIYYKIIVPPSFKHGPKLHLSIIISGEIFHQGNYVERINQVNVILCKITKRHLQS